MQVVHDNVGRWDAIIRVLLSIAFVVGGALSFGRLDPDWYPTAGIGLLIIAGYLILTAVIRIDVAYVAMGIDTVRGVRRKRAGRQLRRMNT